MSDFDKILIDGRPMNSEQVMNLVSELDNELNVEGTAQIDNIIHDDDDDRLTDAESEQSEHDIDSCISFDSECDESTTDNKNSAYYYGKNRLKWSKYQPNTSRSRQHNIIRTHLPGIKGRALTCRPETSYQAWLLLITEEMLQIILDHTNAKITEMSVHYGNTATFIGHLSHTELKAFFGLIYLAICPRKLDKKFTTRCQNYLQTVCKTHMVQQIKCSNCNDQ